MKIFRRRPAKDPDLEEAKRRQRELDARIRRLRELRAIVVVRQRPHKA